MSSSVDYKDIIIKNTINLSLKKKEYILRFLLDKIPYEDIYENSSGCQINLDNLSQDILKDLKKLTEDLKNNVI